MSLSTITKSAETEPDQVLLHHNGIMQHFTNVKRAMKTYNKKETVEKDVTYTN